MSCLKDPFPQLFHFAFKWYFKTTLSRQLCLNGARTFQGQIFLANQPMTDRYEITSRFSAEDIALMGNTQHQRILCLSKYRVQTQTSEATEKHSPPSPFFNPSNCTSQWTTDIKMNLKEYIDFISKGVPVSKCSIGNNMHANLQGDFL